MKKINLLILSGIWPFVKDNNEASNVVVHEIVRCLASNSVYDIKYGCVNFQDIPVTESVKSGINFLESKGVKFLPMIVVKKNIDKSLFDYFKKYLYKDPNIVIRGVGQEDKILNKLDNWWPDAILTIWSEVATAVASNIDTQKFTYYGNPDYIPEEARTKLAWKNDSKKYLPNQFIKYLLKLISIDVLKKAHFKVMKKQKSIYDVTCNFADIYKKNGIKQADYIQNIWIYKPVKWLEYRDKNEQTKPLKIIGNLGNLFATGNTFGIQVLLEKVLPILKKKIGAGNFEVHLFGGGEPYDFLKPLLNDSSIKVRGFVDDIDGEILSSPIFLVTNNFTKFKGGHTRFLHAWLLGSCVVAFRDSAISMPEIEHNYNALLGSNPEELVDMIILAANDKKLRRQLGINGEKTLIEKFNPEKVAARISNDIIQVVN